MSTENEYNGFKDAIANGMKEGLFEPMKTMIKEADEKNKLREQKAEARYELTQKKLEVIEEKVNRLL